MSVSDVLKNLTEPVNAITLPVATSAGQTLANLWELVFGAFNAFAEKKRIIHSKDVEDFKHYIFEGVSKISSENLVEPKLSVIGPILEASKYYIEEREIRELFANLLISSMNAKTEKYVHPSFVKMIEQMTSLEAQNLRIIECQPFPIISIYAKFAVKDCSLGDSGVVEIGKHLFIANPEEQDPSIQSASITLLEHLGLVETTYSGQIMNDTYYEHFEKCGVVEKVIKRYCASNCLGHEILRGMVNISPLGKNFMSSCNPLNDGVRCVQYFL